MGLLMSQGDFFGYISGADAFVIESYQVHDKPAFCRLREMVDVVKINWHGKCCGISTGYFL